MGRENSIEKLIELVNDILRKPAMYEINNVEDLGLVIWGFKSATYLIKSEGEALTEFMTSFREFANKKFNSPIDSNWPRIIRFYSSGDIGSLELFKITFNEFLGSVSK